MVAQEPPGGDDRRMAYWCVARRAMACEFSVLLPPTTPGAMAVAEAALDEIDAMEALLSVYRSDSAVSYLNQYAADGPVRVDDRLFRLLKRSARLTEQTGGAFDVSAGALIRASGFVVGPRRLLGTAERRAALARTGMHLVEFDDRKGTVRHRAKGVELNLGSIGKGYAIDRAIRRMREGFGIDVALIQGGLSSTYGLGSPAGDGRGWLVGIQNPFDPGRRLATVRLRDRALGTSGSANQYFEVNGRRYGHVLDPRTGRPAEELAAASVLAPDGATADALATALLVMGLDKAADFCQNHPAIAALLVLKREPAGRANLLPPVATFNLPPEDVNLRPGQDPPGTRTVDLRT